jgi:hypothetical protein
MRSKNLLFRIVNEKMALLGRNGVLYTFVDPSELTAEGPYTIYRGKRYIRQNFGRHHFMLFEGEASPEPEDQGGRRVNLDNESRRLLKRGLKYICCYPA